MRLVIAERLSRRGEGLGNEMIPWAKAFITSRILGAHLSGTAWGLNKRKYWRNFGTGRLDWLSQEVMKRALPTYPFTQRDFEATGEHDFRRAVIHWARAHELEKRHTYAVTVGGMWGGYLAIESARAFLWSKLLASRSCIDNLFETMRHVDHGKLLVAIHVRAGQDFHDSNGILRTKFNVKLPLSWYAAVAGTLQKVFRDRIQFILVGDTVSEGFKKLAQDLQAITTQHQHLTECSDLCLLSLSDLRICSVSSYSLISCLLAGGPYIWCEEQLGIRNGLYSLWGHEDSQHESNSPFAETEQYLRELGANNRIIQRRNGFHVSQDDSLPDALIAQLEECIGRRDYRLDLIRFGALPTHEWIAP
jgi:hypothetical protein